MIRQNSQPTTRLGSALQILRLIHLTTVQSIRAKHRHPATGLILSVLNVLILMVIFVSMFTILRGGGDFFGGSPINGASRILFMVTGLALFTTHNFALGAVFSAPDLGSPLTNHRPINTTILLIGAALGSLYNSLLTMLVLLLMYHCIVSPLYIDDFIGFMGCVILAWFAGAAIGVFAKAMKPWAPAFIGIAQTVYQRLNMTTSGKFFVVNALPADKRVYFDWNPLFHAIDQARGAAFLNYTPRYTSIEYPIILALVFLTIGLIGEFYTRQQVSLSWKATR